MTEEKTYSTKIACIISLSIARITTNWTSAYVYRNNNRLHLLNMGELAIATNVENNENPWIPITPKTLLKDTSRDNLWTNNAINCRTRHTRDARRALWTRYCSTRIYIICQPRCGGHLQIFLCLLVLVQVLGLRRPWRRWLPLGMTIDKCDYRVRRKCASWATTAGVLQGTRKVRREHALLGGALLHAHQPAFLLQSAKQTIADLI